MMHEVCRKLDEATDRGWCPKGSKGIAKAQDITDACGTAFSGGECIEKNLNALWLKKGGIREDWLFTVL